MKKMCLVILGLGMLLLVGCSSEIEGIPKDSLWTTGEEEYGYATGVILDAIVDTEAEYAYLQGIHDEYSKLRSDYASINGFVDSVMNRDNDEEIRKASEQVGSFKTAMANFQTKIATINLPSEYAASVNKAISYYIQLTNKEIDRLAKKFDVGIILEEAKGMTEAEYKKAEEFHLSVQENYAKIFKNR